MRLIDPLDTDILNRLQRWDRQGVERSAYYTSDLTAPFQPTAVVRRALQRLEKRGLVRRVRTGNPISWELVP